MPVELRSVSVEDVEAIASLHADSWRRNYRGAYTEAFLDGDVETNRRTVWTERLTEPAPQACTLVALIDGDLAGFIHLIRDDDPEWGALIDNLHVTHRHKGHGVGTALQAADPSSRVYLWVLEQNTSAQAFYAARGGACVGRGVV